MPRREPLSLGSTNGVLSQFIAHQELLTMRSSAISPRLRSNSDYRRGGRFTPSIEPLEQRELLTAVSWDGGGDGSNWTDPLNWSNNLVPGAADDVTRSRSAARRVSESRSRQPSATLVKWSVGIAFE